MARFRLASIAIIDPVDVSFTAGDLLVIMWNDSTEAIESELNGVSFTTAGALLGQLGTNYNIVIGISSYEGSYAIAGYSFCDSTDLNWFRMVTTYPEYPFFEKQITTDSPVCDTGGGVVCDIHFVGSPSITHAVDLTSGGSITVLAEGSNGTVRYGLRNSAYTDLTNTTGTFTGIAPGNWTVYAKDVNDCTAVLDFKILYKPVDVEHYRFTWSSVQIGAGTSRDARVRIYEREYVGSLVEVPYADVSPFTRAKPKQGDLNNKFYPIHPTSGVLKLISQQDYQFLPLYTQDNKRYRCVYEVDEGSGFTAAWSGFIVPSVYRENFIATPYTVELQIADNVKTLEKEPFTDDDENLLQGSLKLIKVISLIMKKTGLSLNIRSGINIFEENHNTAATDDPLDQTYIDVACYRRGTEPFTCWEVLEAILKPFGARILQEDNSWIIEEIDRAVADYAYRVFDSNGDYVSNSTTTNQVIDVKAPFETSRAAFTEGDQSLEVIPAYGKINVTSKLNYIGSIVAGGFEKEDLLSPDSETFSNQQGVFTSEEGFKDWTLRLNGTSGVSFGRVLVGRRGDSSRTGLKEEDKTASVGAFYYAPESWGGNLRNAYIESAEKPYQYGPGDEFNFRFEYSTPAKPEFAFMVLRFVIKLGTDYLQQDLTWDSAEHIFRAYPSVSNSLQDFELSVPLPDTDTPVDTTVQVRIYFYASEFYDYGLPPVDTDPANGTDGQSGLDGLVTTGINYDYRLDLRLHQTIGSADVYVRAFVELAYSTAAEDLTAGIIRVGDYNGTTNPKIWRSVGRTVLENNPVGNRRGVDRKFYIDNVTLDALINGQPPPEEDVISYTVSKFINENLDVELYNFDVPDIVNAKNMYNNYFRLSDGTPTALWARSGIAESLSLQQILLKVLGANHSAPTFRMTGSFINEFARIKMNNYLRITKAGSDLVMNNTEFDSDLSSWSQSAIGTSWAWTSDNSGSAEVTLSGSSAESKKIYQEITHSGGYIETTINVKAIPTLSTNDAEDQLWLIFYEGTAIIHTERLTTFPALTSESDYDFTYIALAQENVTRIGFYIKRVTGTGEVNYQVGKFSPTGKDIQEVYQITDYANEERLNTYFFELMQQSKAYISLGGIDTGGNGQGEGTEGRAYSIGYSSGYN